MLKRRFNKGTLVWLAVSVVLFVVLELLFDFKVLNNVYKTVLMTIMINIILAASLNLIIGITGQFSLGHAGFMCIGAYGVGVMIKQMGAGLPAVFVGMAIGIVISVIAALIVAIPTLRLRGDYLAIATLGFGEIIRIIVLNMEITNGAAGLFLSSVVSWRMIYIFMALSLAVISSFIRSRQGRACIAIREDEIAAEAMGVNTTRYKVLAFVVGAIIASIAGGLYAGSFYVIKPDVFTFNKSIDILVIVVFGGMGSLTGSCIAAAVIAVLNQALQQFASLRTIIYGVLTILIMIFRPGGLLGTKELSFAKWFKNGFPWSRQKEGAAK